MQISLRDVGGQTLRVGIRHGEKTNPPLLLFNGIGANIELVGPFLRALTAPRRSFSTCPASAARPRPSFLIARGRWPGSRRGCSISWDTRRWTCSAYPGEGRWRNNSRSSKPRRCRRLILAATSTGSLMVPGKLTVLLKMATPRRYKDPDYMKQGRRQHLWRRAAELPRTGAPSPASRALVKRLRLLFATDRRPAGAVCRGFASWGSQRSSWRGPTIDRACCQRTDPGETHSNARLVTIDDGHLFFVTRPKDSRRYHRGFPELNVGGEQGMGLPLRGRGPLLTSK